MSYNTTIYDKDGKKQQGYVKNGVTYLASGEKLPTGWEVDTNAGRYKMGDDGKGIKVEPTIIQKPSMLAEQPSYNPLIDSIYSNINKDPSQRHINMYDEKGNSAIARSEYSTIRDKINEGWTFDKPENVMFYNPNGDGFQTGINSKYWKDSNAQRGNTEISDIESFRPAMMMAEKGQMTPELLTKYIETVKQNKNENIKKQPTNSNASIANETVDNQRLSVDSQILYNGNENNGMLDFPTEDVPPVGSIIKTNNSMYVMTDSGAVEIDYEEYVRYINDILDRR